MKSGLLLLSAFALATTINATTLTDPYPGSVCASTACDVIGDSTPSASQAGWTVGGAKYDVQSLSVTANAISGDPTHQTVNFSFLFNYNGNSAAGGDASLSPFLNSPGNALMVPADLLFSIRGTTDYGLVLTSHSGPGDPASNGGVAAGDGAVAAGTLYGNATTQGLAIGTRTARQVMNDPANDFYRFDQPVWVQNGNGAAALAAIGSSTLTSSKVGSSPEVMVNVSTVVDIGSQFFADLSSGAMSVSWASATCGTTSSKGRSLRCRVKDSETRPSRLRSACWAAVCLLSR